ncbi:MAG: WXG100 family type VII secretion target [Pseudonocardiaceae bacterium]
MAGELNTEVKSDPASCRATAAWLSRLTPGVAEAGDAIHGARSASESCWQGAAAEAFRDSLNPIRKDSDELAAISDRVRQALEIFADEIDTVRARLRQAREVAVAARLIVTPTAILPPGPSPDTAPVHPIGPMTPEAEAGHADAVRAHEAAVSTYATKVNAFTEASVTVAEARLREADAHSALDAVMDRSGTDAQTLKSIGIGVVSVALGALAGLQLAASDLLRAADKLQEHGARMQALAADSNGPISTRAAAAHTATMAADGEARTRADAERLGRPIRYIPEGIRHGVANSPGEYIRDGGGWVGLGKNAARGVPFVGTGVVVASGAADVAMGKPVGQVAAETGAGLGGGVVGAMAGATIGSAIFPGVGTVVGGVVGGVIGSITATEGVGRAMGDQ